MSTTFKFLLAVLAIATTSLLSINYTKYKYEHAFEAYAKILTTIDMGGAKLDCKQLGVGEKFKDFADYTIVCVDLSGSFGAIPHIKF